MDTVRSIREWWPLHSFGAALSSQPSAQEFGRKPQKHGSAAGINNGELTTTDGVLGGASKPQTPPLVSATQLFPPLSAAPDAASGLSFAGDVVVDAISVGAEGSNGCVRNRGGGSGGGVVVVVEGRGPTALSSDRKVSTDQDLTGTDNASIHIDDERSNTMLSSLIVGEADEERTLSSTSVQAAKKTFASLFSNFVAANKASFSSHSSSSFSSLSPKEMLSTTISFEAAAARFAGLMSVSFSSPLFKKGSSTSTTPPAKGTSTATSHSSINGKPQHQRALPFFMGVAAFMLGALLSLMYFMTAMVSLRAGSGDEALFMTTLSYPIAQ